VKAGGQRHEKTDATSDPQNYVQQLLGSYFGTFFLDSAAFSRRTGVS
jgi:hypothetical protein